MFINILCHFVFEGIAKDSHSTGEVHIWVKECKNLSLIRATIDPYVKWYAQNIPHKQRYLFKFSDALINVFPFPPGHLKLCAARHEQEESAEDARPAEDSGSSV